MLTFTCARSEANFVRFQGAASLDLVRAKLMLMVVAELLALDKMHAAGCGPLGVGPPPGPLLDRCACTQRPPGPAAPPHPPASPRRNWLATTAVVMLVGLSAARLCVLLAAQGSKEAWVVIHHEQIKAALELTSVACLLWWLNVQPPNRAANNLWALTLRGFSVAFDQVGWGGGGGRQWQPASTHKTCTHKPAPTNHATPQQAA
jgi:hypothetical protein